MLTQRRFNTNAILASIWATLDVFRDAELLERVRRDVELCRSGAGRLDIDKLLKRPLLQSIYAETLRLRVHVYISRFAEHEELSVGDWSIPKKSAVLVSTTPAHLDPDAWNTGRDGRHPVDAFWADRFLVHPGDAERTGPLRRSSEAGAARRRCDSVVGDDDSNEPVFSADNISGSWFPYGGGVRMCPGRQFAKREVLLTLALMASLFDVEVGADAAALQMSWADFGLGTQRPTGRLPFRIRRRRSKSGTGDAGGAGAAA